MDFTPKKYKQLLLALKNAGYLFVTFEEYCTEQPIERHIILRHDVDLLPERSLALAQIEHSLDIKATYYFRIVPESNQPEYIRAIADLGHEIAYHYEDLTLAKGDMELSYEMYKKHLNYFRQFYLVKTISMHGSPASKYDNRDIWKENDYRDFNIIGEPYFDFIDENVNIDGGKKFYFTDTGRMWDGDKFNVRDKAINRNKKSNVRVHTTEELARFLTNNSVVQSVMINTHPQRWTDNKIGWVKELIIQRMKNLIKSWIVKRQK